MRAFKSLAAIAIVLAAPASAGEITHFNRAAFQELQARNAPAIVFVHASWCPICRAQQATISKLLATPEYRGVTVLTIDYDTQKPLWTSFGAQKQSTLIAFHGRRETARLAYDADPQKVTALVASTLK
jgi:thioredoxin-like negative regulator of GroEL